MATIKFKIEKGIAVQSRAKYPLREMEIGDSFLVPANGDESRVVLLNKVCSATRYEHSRGKRRFTAHTVEGGIRVWRIE